MGISPLQNRSRIFTADTSSIQGWENECTALRFLLSLQCFALAAHKLLEANLELTYIMAFFLCVVQACGKPCCWLWAGNSIWASARLAELPFRALHNSGVRPEKLYLCTSPCCKTPKSAGPACSWRVGMLERPRSALGVIQIACKS